MTYSAETLAATGSNLIYDETGFAIGEVHETFASSPLIATAPASHQSLNEVVTTEPLETVGGNRG